jgi:hypothetical protein
MSGERECSSKPGVMVESLPPLGGMGLSFACSPSTLVKMTMLTSRTRTMIPNGCFSSEHLRPSMPRLRRFEEKVKTPTSHDGGSFAKLMMAYLAR